MKTISFWKRLLIGFLFPVLSIGCAPVPSETRTPEPTATIQPTIAPAASETPTAQPNDFERKIMVDDLERSYLLHTPPDLNSQQPVPVVFAFHGWGQTPLNIKKMADLDDIANQANFIVVYPKGIEETWNYGGESNGAASTGSVDELAFIRTMLSDLETIITIDLKRIYAVGFSQGAALVYRLACDMSDIFAAVAPVSHSMDHGACQPKQAISVLHVHGLLDTIRTYSDGVEEGIATWGELNNCTDPVQVEKLCHTFVDQIHMKLDECTDSAQVDVTHTTYASCQAGTAVELYAITSGRHVWPTNYIPPFSEIIWDFFATHPKT